MSALKNINRYRRRIMNALTSNIADTPGTVTNLNPMSIKRILVTRPNHRLGNLLLVTPLLQELEATFPHAKIDFFAKGYIAEDLLKNYSSIDRLLMLPKKHFRQLGSYIFTWLKLKNKRYDLVVNVAGSSSSGRLSSKFANARLRMFSVQDTELEAILPDYVHMAKAPVYNLRRFLGMKQEAIASRPIPTINIKLSSEEYVQGEGKLAEITKNHNKTILIYTYATGDKCYGPEWWEPFYQRLQKEFTDYNIVEILPVENVSQIGFKAPHFYSKDLRLICSVIANAEIFIGADSGMMHLASAAQIPVAGLFSVSNLKGYQPYGNHSMGINTNNTHMEDWMRTIKNMISDSHHDGKIKRAANY
ncbi:hypothetical protein VF12_39915 [Nostoc linckia z15]|nr:hypothetical protein VF12_39915 [Nostoc linckia z15]